MAEFKCEIQERPPFVIARPVGYLDEVNGKALLAAFDEPFHKGIRKFVLNLSRTPVINSQGITQILELVEAVLYEHKGQLALVGLSELYVDVFEVVGILKLVQLFPDEESALAAA